MNHTVARIADIAAGAAACAATYNAIRGEWLLVAVWLAVCLIGLGVATDAHIDTTRRTT